MADCLKVLGFQYDRTESSHEVYVHPTRRLVVPLDIHWNPASGPMVKHVVTTQVRVDRDDFYCATKTTAKKIGKRVR